jgi:hypothetical protein
MKAASVGPASAPIVINGSTGTVNGRRPTPFLASKTGENTIQEPANAMTKYATSGCLISERLRVDGAADGDLVECTDMIATFLAIHG